MGEVLGVDSLDALIDETVPPQIRLPQPLQLEPPRIVLHGPTGCAGVDMVGTSSSRKRRWR